MMTLMSSELTISKNGVFLLFYFYVFIIRPEGAQKRRKVCEEWVVVLSFNHGFIANNFCLSSPRKRHIGC
jgi:hypothetical protein